MLLPYATCLFCFVIFIVCLHVKIASSVMSEGLLDYAHLSVICNRRQFKLLPFVVVMPR